MYLYDFKKFVFIRRVKGLGIISEGFQSQMMIWNSCISFFLSKFARSITFKAKTLFAWGQITLVWLLTQKWRSIQLKVIEWFQERFDWKKVHYGWVKSDMHTNGGWGMGDVRTCQSKNKKTTLKNREPSRCFLQPQVSPTQNLPRTLWTHHSLTNHCAFMEKVNIDESEKLPSTNHILFLSVILIEMHSIFIIRCVYCIK